MEWKREILRGAVREGYQILLRAECALLLPDGYERIEEYYRKLGQKCLSWIVEVHGERLRECFAAAESVREKAGFGTADYRFGMRCTFCDETMLSMVCDTVLTGRLCAEELRQRRASAVWLLSEQTMLPHEQVTSRFSLTGKQTRVGFVPDGVYPEGDSMVFFKNAVGGREFCEQRIPLPPK